MAGIAWDQIEGALPTELLAAMKTWDGQMLAHRPEPLVYYAWLRAMVRGVYADELGEQFDAINTDDAARLLHTLTRASHWCDDQTTAAAEDCAVVQRAAFASAYALLQDRYGEDWWAWRWGEAHQARFRHMLFGFIPVLRDVFDVSTAHGGSRDTPNAGYVSFDEGNLFQQVHGASFRAVYDLADLNRSRFIQAVGQSGNIFSSHYADLLPLWAQGETVTLAPMAGEAQHVLRLVPAGAEGDR